MPVGPRRARDPIKGLPAGVRVYRVKVKGVEYWRARLGSRFTGGHVQVKHFQALEDARKWVFGDAKKKKAETGLSLIELKARAGATAFELTPAQIAEAIDVFKRLVKRGAPASSAGWPTTPTPYAQGTGKPTTA